MGFSITEKTCLWAYLCCIFLDKITSCEVEGHTSTIDQTTPLLTLRGDGGTKLCSSIQQPSHSVSLLWMLCEQLPYSCNNALTTMMDCDFRHWIEIYSSCFEVLSIRYLIRASRKLARWDLKILDPLYGFRDNWKIQILSLYYYDTLCTFFKG